MGVLRIRFSFFVDPPSDSTIHMHIERMMRRCSAFVAVVNRRRGAGEFFCSPFVLYEYGLSIQARRPRLLLIDDRVGDRRFHDLPDGEKHFFSAARPDLESAALRDKIGRLHASPRTTRTAWGDRAVPSASWSRSSARGAAMATTARSRA